MNWLIGHRVDWAEMGENGGCIDHRVRCLQPSYSMLTSRHENAFRITGPLWGNACHKKDQGLCEDNPRLKGPVMRTFLQTFSWLLVWTQCWTNSRSAGDLGWSATLQLRLEQWFCKRRIRQNAQRVQHLECYRLLCLYQGWGTRTLGYSYSVLMLAVLALNFHFPYPLASKQYYSYSYPRISTQTRVLAWVLIFHGANRWLSARLQ